MIFGWLAAIPSQPKLHSFSDAAIYTKFKNDLQGHWSQEVGVSGPFANYGSLSLAWNVGYSDAYPIRTDRKASWTAGATLGYLLHKDQYQPTIYTKIKSNLNGVWQEESGLTARIATIKRTVISANLAYLETYPIRSGQKPIWIAQLVVSYKFK